MKPSKSLLLMIHFATISLLLNGQTKSIKLTVLDPGHFHAALVQKTMYADVSTEVEVYAPAGPEYQSYKDKIEAYNSRKEDPTSWKLQEHLSDDFLNEFIQNSKGNVVVLAGNNKKKTTYIYEAVKLGKHVFADKPMAITPEDYTLLLKAFEVAKTKGVMIYDIMTERFEITTMLQKHLSGDVELFGNLEKGSKDSPAIEKESVHYFSKQVSGSQLVRPQWFFDVSQEGEGIVDVTTHLIDLAMWECFPGKAIKKKQVGTIIGKQWATKLTFDQFSKVTQAKKYPTYLEKNVGKDGNLSVNCNGQITFDIDGVWSKVGVTWGYEALPGTGDTHFSIMRGSKANLVIRQGQEEKFIPQLYIEQVGKSADFEQKVKLAVASAAKTYPGIEAKMLPNGSAMILIPESYRNGHEAHFGQVTNNFIKYLEAGKLPDWEIDNMLTKYYITTQASENSK
ncbi:MAG TPA: putative oxidoreductase C-terminal domain-containing protein [Saprospiraceae bacterium]|nr:putative oxidoreductase C-terminal domain-containing protein [Saprospiraceae bacterium]HPN68197.1 putative oxidoreductase C-terminal domain-containing protein [Saprospiraceae bacterium]